jgi:iron complex transport system substrate-binding protein
VLAIAAMLAVTYGGRLVTRLAGPGAQDAGRPERVISLVPATTEMLFAMGAGDAVVGVGSYDRHPPEIQSLPKVGALIDPDVERILSLRPDLVVVYGTQDDLILRLEQAGISMFRYQHAGLPDITETLRSLGARVGRAAEADRVADAIEADLAAIRDRVAGRDRPRTALLFGREAGTLRGLFASGALGFLHDMLVVAGGDDVFADVQAQSAQISIETLLARAPVVIMEVHPSDGWTPDVIARDLRLWQTAPAIPAVRNGRIYILADSRLLVPGPRIAEAVRLMAEALHPEAFRDAASSAGVDGSVLARAR